MANRKNRPAGTFRFSPSIHHRRVMDHTVQALSHAGGDVAAWQRWLRRRLRRLLGDAPSQRVPLNVRSLWKRRGALGGIEKILFTSEPGADAPAYVCIPKGIGSTPTWPGRGCSV